MIDNVTNNDGDVNQYYKILFLPDYKVSFAQIIIPSVDISQHIFIIDMEESDIYCMRFVMTGSIIIAAHDGTNIKISDKI